MVIHLFLIRTRFLVGKVYENGDGVSRENGQDMGALTTFSALS
jgi:hypothetical protein